MPSSLDTFERQNLPHLLTYEAVALPKRTWRTPSREWWTPQAVLTGWRSRVSDHWAWLTLHAWVVEDRVDVAHVELPRPLQQHDPSDAAWAYVDAAFGPGERDGRADLSCDGLLVEFGACAPARFVLGLGGGGEEHWMIVPYGCEYGFVFVPKEVS